MQQQTTMPEANVTARQPAPNQYPRLWLPVGLVVLYWLASFVLGWLEKPYFVGFLYGLASAALLTLVFFGWWWFNRRVRFNERLYSFVVVVGLGALVAPFVHPSFQFGLLTGGLPIVLTVWTLWLLVVNRTGLAWRRLGLLVVVALTWGCFTLIRIEGLDADLRADIRWRWTPSAEELFLAERAQAGHKALPVAAASQTPLALAPGDWPAFRGSERDGVIRGVSIATDWNSAPPRLLWRRRVGPGWSSVIVIGDRLFTQEQRDGQEAVVCYEAATGSEWWVHENSCRFWEPVSGAGPRATPTFAGGRIYALGATGVLNCLDAVTSHCYWSREIAAEAGAKTPQWGFSGSPLVVKDLVIVFAGGDGGKQLLAYRTATGDLAWAAPASSGSYGSPQLTTVAGEPQCLMVGDHGLTAVDPATGAMLWQRGAAVPGAPRNVQAHLLGQGRLVAATLEGSGMSLLDVTRQGDRWTADTVWASTELKPEFPDFVVHQDHIYGFDRNIFCCLEAATGKRMWKEGRYGRGQVMLLEDQSLLLVLSEKGEALLLAANPQKHDVRARFQALAGKTWNHPVIAHGRLYVRNAEEMACYQVGID